MCLWKRFKQFFSSKNSFPQKFDTYQLREKLQQVKNQLASARQEKIKTETILLRLYKDLSSWQSKIEQAKTIKNFSLQEQALEQSFKVSKEIEYSEEVFLQQQSQVDALKAAQKRLVQALR